MTVMPPNVALHTRLRDGCRVLFRPIWPSDKDGLADGLARMSLRSRSMRFHGPVDGFTPEQLRYLTEIDYRDHMAWVALDLSAPGGRGIGVARYVRRRDRPDVAEPAVAVVDSHQGLGLGPSLLGALARWAADNGIAAMEATVQAGNRPMLKMMQDLGGRIEPDGEGLMRVSSTIPRTPLDIVVSEPMRMFARAFQARPDSGARW